MPQFTWQYAAGSLWTAAAPSLPVEGEGKAAIVIDLNLTIIDIWFFLYLIECSGRSPKRNRRRTPNWASKCNSVACVSPADHFPSVVLTPALMWIFSMKQKRQFSRIRMRDGESRSHHSLAKLHFYANQLHSICCRFPVNNVNWWDCIASAANLLIAEFTVFVSSSNARFPVPCSVVVILNFRECWSLVNNLY